MCTVNEELKDVAQYDHYDSNPPLENDVSKAVYAVVNDDLNLLKTVLSMYKNITDRQGYNLLHIAIIKKRRNIFDYLLRIGADIEAKCPNGDTPLLFVFSLATTDSFRARAELDDFAAELIRKGANVNLKSTATLGCSLLCSAIARRFFQSAKLLIPTARDLCCLKCGHTALERVTKIPIIELTLQIELVSMLIYYGATVTKDCLKWASSYQLIEFLYDYIFDEIDTDDVCVISVPQLFKVFFSKTEYFPRILHKITHLDFLSVWYMYRIFSIKPEYLLWLVGKFPLETKEIVRDHTIFFTLCTEPNELKNIEILFESPAREELVSQFNKFRKLSMLLIDFDRSAEEDIEKFIMLLLSYGVNLQVEWLESIYSRWGYSDLFKHLLMFNVRKSSFQPGIGSILVLSICSVRKNISAIIQHTRERNLRKVADFLPYCSRLSFVEYCKDLNVCSEEQLNLLPPVPTLKEIARDASRSSIVKQFNVKNCSQFYYVLRHLFLPISLKKVISFEVPLYNIGSS